MAKLLVALSLILVALSVPMRMHAAVLYLEPSHAEYNLGDTFIEEVRLDTQGEYINAVEVHIDYPKDLLEIRDFGKGNSVLSVWAQEPEHKDGKLSFIGGVPAGYQGYDGILGKIAFLVKPQLAGGSQAGNIPTEVKFGEGNLALLNDGEGTEAKVETRNAIILIAREFSVKRVDEWLEEVERDGITPEPFSVEISNNADVYGGKFFILFSAVDKQTGIDHYEVFEYRGGKTLANKDAQSPYLLENQKLDGIIRVRAVDKAGNEAIVELRPTGVAERKRELPWVWIALGILGLMGLVITLKATNAFTKSH